MKLTLHDMRRRRPLASAALFTAASVGYVPLAAAQNIAAPVYQGYQPKLIQGIEDGLASGAPKVRHVYLADPLTLAIVIDAQAIPLLPVAPYVPQPGDEIRRRSPSLVGDTQREEFRFKTVYRDGKALGPVHGAKLSHYSPAHTLEGEPLDLAAADTPANYALSSTSDADYAAPTVPERVSRKSESLVSEWVGPKPTQTARHELFLRLPRPLKPGASYRLRLAPALRLPAEVSFTFDDTKLRSEAIHVNLHGYHPHEPDKHALMSMWLGSGGDAQLAGLEQFQIVDDAMGETVFRGPIRLLKRAVAGKQMGENHTVESTDDIPMSVYRLDFDGLKREGEYRVVVPGLGSSFPFRIDREVWNDVTKLSARGYLSQRAGIAIGPPHSDYVRPRAMHPDDGFRVYATDPEVFYDVTRFPEQSGGGNLFKRIQASIIESSSVPEAWGGWMDAADCDRSILPQCHTHGVHAMVDLWESNPAYFEQLELNLPESGNGIPDILDEALWCMDLFLRIQQADGGVPSAVESIEHPAEPSYLLSQSTAVTPPTPQTCHSYAAAAAQLSLALRKYDSERAEAYRDSALRAMEWAERHADVPNAYHRRDMRPAEEDANRAAAWMYRLTEDQRWHEMFRQSLAARHPDGQIQPTRYGYTGPWGIAAYAMMPAEKTDTELRQRCREALLRQADELVSKTEALTFNINAAHAQNWGERLGTPEHLVIAHRLDPKPEYIRALVQSAQFAMGLNPDNHSYTSGLGDRSVVVFHLDATYLGMPYPEGITTYGPMPRNLWGGDQAEKELGHHMYPEWKQWPWAESFNVRYHAITEYTVGGSMATHLRARGYLAQHFARRASADTAQ